MNPLIEAHLETLKLLETVMCHKDTLQRQLNVVDTALPQWTGTGKGRIDTIEDLVRKAALYEVRD